MRVITEIDFIGSIFSPFLVVGFLDYEDWVWGVKGGKSTEMVDLESIYI